MSAIALPARTENLGELIRFISRFAGDRGFSERRTRQIELAAEEALVNVVKHAYRGREDGEVAVRCDIAEGGRLKIHITDRGTPFHPEDVAPPDLKAGLGERKVGGLGLLLMDRMADAVRRRREGDRNILTLIFKNETLPDSQS